MAAWPGLLMLAACVPLLLLLLLRLLSASLARGVEGRTSMIVVAGAHSACREAVTTLVGLAAAGVCMPCVLLCQTCTELSVGGAAVVADAVADAAGPRVFAVL